MGRRPQGLGWVRLSGDPPPRTPGASLDEERQGHQVPMERAQLGQEGGGSQDTWLGGAEVPRVPGFWNCNLSSLRFTTTTN